MQRNDYINETIDWLKAGGDDGEHEFDMSYIYSESFDGCKTACCMCGYMGMLACVTGELDMTPSVFGNRYYPDAFSDIASLLGIGVNDAHKLFFPDDWRLSTIKPEQATKVLEHLRDTGEVDWGVADKLPEQGTGYYG